APFSQGVSPVRYLCSQSISMTSRRENGLNQKRDPNRADRQTDQPKRSASDQNRNRPDRDSDLEHRYAAGQNLVRTQMGLSLLLQFLGLFRNGLFFLLILRHFLFVGGGTRFPKRLENFPLAGQCSLLDSLGLKVAPLVG